MNVRPWVHAAAIGAALVGCDPATAPNGGAHADAGASPNASILPAPLVSEPPEAVDAGTDAAPSGIPADSAGRLLLPDAGAPPPEALRPDAVMPVEVPGSRELSGVTLEAAWRWRDVPAAPKAAEVNAEGLKAAQKLTALSWKIDLSDGGRMRIEFTSRALPLPTFSEIRGRVDRYGAIVLWPNATQYRVVAPGALRTVIGERRVDVTPLSLGAVQRQGEGKRLGVATRKVEIGTSLGSLRLELGKVPDAGEGGVVLCRAIIEIAGVDPRSTLCQPGEVPLSAAYSWQDGGGVTLEVTSIARRNDFGPGDLVVPPQGAVYVTAGLPAAPDGIFLTRDEIAAFRTAPLPPPAHPSPGAPGEGFFAVNQSDTLSYLLLDGIPVVAVPPGNERYLIGTMRGRYVAEWRTFLGDRILPPQSVELPARLVHGGPADAGAPDGG